MGVADAATNDGETENGGQQIDCAHKEYIKYRQVKTEERWQTHKESSDMERNPKGGETNTNQPQIG